MRSRALIYFFSLFFSLLFLMPAFAEIPANDSVQESCRAFLATAKQMGRTNGPLAKFFFESPRVLYNDGKMPRSPFPFYASNEFDWHNMPWDDSPTDVVVGFGTNSAWDVASRQRAKLLIIGDHTAGPLIAQNFILRPLLRVSRTPAEYIALIGGVDLPDSHLDDTLAGIEGYLDHFRETTTPEQKLDGMQNVVRSLTAKEITDVELRAIADYYLAMVKPTRDGYFGPLHSKGAHQTGDLRSFFRGRYFPGLRKKIGATDAIEAPEDSFLASQAAFDRFRELYVSALYAHTDYESPDFYREVKTYGDQRGYRKYTFSLSNIMDTAALTKGQAIAELQRVRRVIYETFPRNEYEVVIFATTNHQPSHGFLRLERDTRVIYENWVRD